VPELETERLLLRHWRDGDRDPYAALNADPEVTEFLTPGGVTMSREESDAQVDRFLEHWDRWGYGLFAVEVKATGEFIGFEGLSHHRALRDDVEIGWRLARATWGKGYATEAATATRDWAFAELRLPRLISITLEENVRSWHIMEKLGMRFWRWLPFEDWNLKVYELSPPD
jgi:RimJ/RimL family protein N-acetyltransferase